MDLNRLSGKSRQALHDAQAIALRRGNTEVGAGHVLLALADQRDGLARRLLKRLEVSVGALRSELERHLARLPRVSGPGASGQVSISRPLGEILDAAERTAQGLEDEYVSGGHLLLAIADAGSRTEAGALLGAHGVTRDRVLDAMTEIRGGPRGQRGFGNRPR